MKAIHVLMLLLSLMLVMGTVFFACGDDDDDDDDDAGTEDDDDATDDDATDDDATDDDATDDDATDDDATDDDATDDDDDDDATDDDDDDDETPPTDAITVTLYDFSSGLDIEGVTCELVQSANGQSFNPPITTTSDADGECSFNESKEKGVYSIKFTMTGYVDSYSFNNSAALDLFFPLVTPNLRAGIYLTLMETLDTTKATVAGVVQWSDGAQLQEVGCSVVTSDTGTDIYYLDDTNLPSLSRTNTNPNNGYYLTLNVDPGAYTFWATTNSFQTSADVPALFADSIVYQNIVYRTPEFASNPTPGGCTK